MKNDMITLFNQLTSSELADYTLFTNILENHYEKFRYLYHMINDINLNKVVKIYCKETKSTITVYIEPHENKYINDIVYIINKKKNTYYNSEYFTTNISESKNILIIDISMSNDHEEGDIYANRFV